MSHAPVTLDQPESYFQMLERSAQEHWWSVCIERIENAWLKKAMKQRDDASASRWDWLDVGCGAGSRLRKWGDWDCWSSRQGVEPDQVAIEMVQDLIDDGVRIESGNLPVLNYGDESVSLVTAFDVIQHVPGRDRQQAINELARILSPGGLLIIRTNGAGLRTCHRNDNSIVQPAFLKHELRNQGFSILNESHFNFSGGMVEDIVQIARRFVRSRSTATGSKKHGLPRKWESRPQGHWLGRIAGRLESQIVANGVVKLPMGHSYIIIAIKDVHHGRSSLSRTATASENWL